MAGRIRHETESVRNKAQEERAAEDKELKRFTDTAAIQGGETWENPTGHSGTRRAWAVSLTMVAAFLLAGGGFTFGPRVLLWIGVGVFVLLGAYSLIARTWTDYARDTSPQGGDEDRSAVSQSEPDAGEPG